MKTYTVYNADFSAVVGTVKALTPVAALEAAKKKFPKVHAPVVEPEPDVWKH
jgi:hypothetical protein